MKKAFEHYFSKLNNYAEEKFGTKPTVTFMDELNKDLLVSAPDEDGEVEWQPKLQMGNIIWDEVENEIGFTICQELKEYYSSYSFLMLYGKFGTSYLNFYPIDASEPVANIIERAFYDAQEVFPCSQMFLIGNASVNEDDNFFIYYDNKTGKLFCYDTENKREVLLSYSIAKTIDMMEARM
jgi:hypothetical protein